jgi:hypothetical protein
MRHFAEFVHPEEPAILANAQMFEKNRPPGLEFDQEAKQSHQGNGNKQSYCRQGAIKKFLYHVAIFPEAKASSIHD